VAEIARVMMIDAALPLYLWPFAIETAVYIVNRLIKEGDKKSPLQKYRELLNLPNQIPNLDFIRIWGCRAYVHIQKEDRVKSLKMLPRAKIGRPLVMRVTMATSTRSGTLIPERL